MANNKKSRNSKKKSISSKKTRSKKEVAKNVKEESKKVDKAVKKVAKEEKAKEEKIVTELEKPKVKKKKNRKKINRKQVILLIITFVFIVLLILLFLLNNRSYNNKVSFISKNKIIVSPLKNNYSSPVYSYAIDKKGKPITIENLKFEDNSITFSFDDIKREIIDDDSVLLTIPCNMEVEMEYTEVDDIEEEWEQAFSYMPIVIFDYYTGDIYLEKNISNTKLDITSFDNKEEMKYTEILVHNQKIKIGILNNLVENKWKTPVYQGNNGEGRLYKIVNNSKIIMYIKAPKNYDGVMFAIDKKGVDYDSWKMENEQNKESDDEEIVHKLIDKDDEKRKDYDKDDYYIIRVRDMFKDDYVATVEESTNFLYIIGMVTLVMAIITTIAMFLQERK